MWVGGNTDTFSERRFRDRMRFVSLVFGIGYAVIVLRLFHLQVVRGNDLAQMSEINRTQVMLLHAPRGDFYDRKGRAIVKNRPSWSLMYSVPEKSKVNVTDLEQRLAPFLAPFPAYWTKRLEHAFRSKQMVRLAEDVPANLAFLMREMVEVFPGLRVAMEFRRGYPLGVTAAHLIGYLREINEDELDEPLWSKRKSGDLIGKMGLEKIQDEVLRGRDGGMLIEIDSVGRLKRIIRELPFEKGGSIHLTLDLDIQHAAEEELAKTETKKGAVVAMDVNTGAILAWASAPSFDPIGSMAENLRDANSPFLDRVYRGAYPPGSVFKVITAIAGFERGVIRTDEKVQCVGYVTLPDRYHGGEKRYRCWKVHGWVDYWSAMTQSCDTYFYLLGRKIGPDAIAETAKEFGLGSTVQSTLPGENKGTIPNPEWKRRAGLGGWSMGDTYNMAIGQGYVTATPLQLATMMAGVATRGKIYRPYMVDRIVDGAGGLVSVAAPTLERTVNLKESTWDAVIKSLENVVSQGTGVATRIPYLDVRGKTGTAENVHGDDHAWFAAFAGYKGEAPSVAVCVLVENGGHGGAVAAPIAKHVLEVALPDRTIPLTAVTPP